MSDAHYQLIKEISIICIPLAFAAGIGIAEIQDRYAKRKKAKHEKAMQKLSVYDRFNLEQSKRGAK